jgi:hypothetical protein
MTSVCCVPSGTTTGVCLKPAACEALAGDHYEKCNSTTVCSAGVTCEEQLCPTSASGSTSVNVCAEGSVCSAQR